MRAAATGAIVALALLGGGCATGSAETARSPRHAALAEPSLPAAQPFRFFSADSFWNRPLPADAPLDPSSAAVVGQLIEDVAQEQAEHKGPAINTTAWSVPLYTVPAGEPTVRVALRRRAPEPALQRAFDAVPLPAGAQPAEGTDSVLAVWQPSTDRLWEFWRLKEGPEGWEASWGGAMRHARADSGVYTPRAWPGAWFNWGSSASSLSIVGGLMTLEDLQRGTIDHALEMSVPDVRAGVFASPAQRTDGTSTDPLALPEGAHLRLDPRLDLAGLHLPRLTLMMARAAQRYGIFVRDTAANVAFYAQDPIPTGAEPYTGPSGYFEGNLPNHVLAEFPWSHLELLRMELHRHPRRRP